MSNPTSEQDVVCTDCKRPYTSFDLDMVLPHSQWNIIAPEGGILCPNCIVHRASKLKGVIVIHAVIEFNHCE